MGKQNKKPISKKKKIILIILIVIFSPIVAIALWALILYGIYMPIAKYFDHQKMSLLDSQMQNLYSQIVAVKDADEDWKYQAVCDDQYVGWATTGKYDCLTSISLQKTVTSATEVQALHDKYYPIIDGIDSLEQTTQLITPNGGSFQSFVLSSEEKRYTEQETKIGCHYILSLASTEDYKIDDYYTGSKITSNGQATLTFQCYKLSLGQWYTKYRNNGQLIPNTN